MTAGVLSHHCCNRNEMGWCAASSGGDGFGGGGGGGGGTLGSQADARSGIKLKP